MQAPGFRHALSALLVLIANLAHADSPAAALAPGWHDDLSIQVGEDTRYFRYFIPSNLLDPAPPVVLFFHGGTQSMRSTMPPSSQGSAAWPFVAEAEGFVLIVPNGMGDDQDAFGDDQRWNDCRSDGVQVSQADDVAFVEALLDWSLDNLGHDPDAVFATGNSNGGMMTFRLAQERPDLITAGASFIANLPANSQCEEQDEPVPMMIANGTLDTWSPYGGGQLIFGNGEVLSTDATVDYWLEINGIQGTPVVKTLLQLEPDEPSQIELLRFPGDQSVDTVRFYRMIDAGHTMPTLSRPISALAESVVGPQNRDIEGAAATWDFFRQFYLTDADRRHALSGHWYDPTRSGEGYNFMAGQAGASLFYYGADPEGERLWLVSDLITHSVIFDQDYIVTLYRTVGGQLGQPVPPPDGILEWGQATIRFHDCAHADFVLEGEDGELLESEVVRLLEISNTRC